MRVPTTARAALTGCLLAAALTAALTGCGTDDDGGGDRSGTPATSATTSGKHRIGPDYDPEDWRDRVDALAALSDRTDATCSAEPQSSVCAATLKDIDAGLTSMATALRESGEGASYPETVKSLDTALQGYRDYTTGHCEGDPAAGAVDSVCRLAMASVSLGPQTLKTSMHTDD